MRANVEDLSSKAILISLDAAAVFVSICLAYLLRVALDTYFFVTHSQPLASYTGFSLVFLATLSMLTYEGAYTRRYDFCMRAGRSSKHSASHFLS